MITRLEYQISKSIFQSLKDEIPDFEHRLDINSPTGNFFYDKWVISENFKNTVWEDVLNSLPFAVGEARLMKLEPGNAYYSHADVDDRYHLNITGDKSFLVDLDENKLLTVNNDGYWYEMNAGIRHSAVNFGNQTRVQLVVRKLLQKNNLVDPVSVKIDAEKSKHDQRYVFDDVYSPWLNRFIKLGQVDNFSFRDNQVSFDVERTLISELEKLCPGGFRILCQQNI